jgi:hypothetical protein
MRACGRDRGWPRRHFTPRTLIRGSGSRRRERRRPKRRRGRRHLGGRFRVGEGAAAAERVPGVPGVWRALCRLRDNFPWYILGLHAVSVDGCPLLVTTICRAKGRRLHRFRRLHRLRRPRLHCPFGAASPIAPRPGGAASASFAAPASPGDAGFRLPLLLLLLPPWTLPGTRTRTRRTVSAGGPAGAAWSRFLWPRARTRSLPRIRRRWLCAQRGECRWTRSSLGRCPGCRAPRRWLCW